MSVFFRANLKTGSKKLAELLESKYSLKIKHGHALDVISVSLGFRDWNTMSAALEKVPSSETPQLISNVGALIDQLSLLPRNMPVFGEYQLSQGVIDEEDGSSYFEATMRAKELVAFNSSDGFVLELLNPTNKKNLTSSLSKIPQNLDVGLEPEKFRQLVQTCEQKINESESFRFDVAEHGVYLTQLFAFNQTNEIFESDPEIAQEYGVTWAYDREAGLQLSDFNGPGEPNGNIEGFIDELQMGFRDLAENRAHSFFERFGFSAQVSEWQSKSLLTITAVLRFDDSEFESNLFALLKEITDSND